MLFGLAFLNRGQLATTREIADAAGISQAVLYQHLGSEEEALLRRHATASRRKGQSLTGRRGRTD